MCNVYKVKRKRQANDLEAAVNDAIDALPSTFVRRSGKGVAVTLHDDTLVAGTMRWGFSRSFSKAINNARSDNLASTVWIDAHTHRRCLVPMSSFYEWQHLAGGRKQAHEFRRHDGEWIWVAGLWEPSDEHGDCFATITTDPPSWMTPIHDRMLAITSIEAGEAFLRGENPPFAPYAGPLLAGACDSPLKRRTKPGDRDQGNLF